ncbi:hypothetical protein DMV64_09555, partial [Neisseria gonorrhoeae]
IPAKAGIQTFKLRPFPINSCYFSLLDSRLRGNDEWRCKSNSKFKKAIPPGLLPDRYDFLDSNRLSGCRHTRRNAGRATG